MNARLSVWALLALAAWCLTAAAPLLAREHALSKDMCIGGAPTAAEALALASDQLDCEDPQLSAEAVFVRASVALPDGFDTTGEAILWQTDPAYFESMILRFTYADQSQSLVEIDPQMAAREWFARTRFSVRVPENEARLIAIDQVVERPRTKGVVKDARLVSEVDARGEHFIRSVFYALLCGLLLVPILYDLMFFRLLRSRFLIWHAALAASQLVFVFSNWGLIFHFFPDVPLYLRFHLNTISMTASVVFAVLFVRDLLEKKSTPLRLQQLVLALAGLVVILKAVTLLDLESLRMTAHGLFILAIIAVNFAVFVIVVAALLRGSKAARFLLVALFGIMLSGVVEIFSKMGLLSPLFPVDDVLFLAMVMLVLGTSAAAGDRFLVLRMERDRARMEAMRLSRLALSDPLTGLANRRAFEQLEAVEVTQCLLVADIDHFKRINDDFGHATGDAVLAHLARLMREAFADIRNARLFRMGGEEFAILLPCSGHDALRKSAELLRRHVDQAGGVSSAGIPPVTISVGGAIGDGRQVGEIFAQADEALYRAKAAGRNRSAIVAPDGQIRVA